MKRAISALGVVLILLLSFSVNSYAATSSTNSSSTTSSSTTSSTTSNSTTTHTSSTTAFQTTTASTVELPIWATELAPNSPATIVIEFPFTNNFNLTVLPSLTNTPLHYTVTTSPQLDTINVLLNTSDTYFIYLNLNYTLPVSGLFTYYIYSQFVARVGTSVPFVQKSTYAINSQVIASPYIDITTAVKEALQTQLGFLITVFNATQAKELGALNQEISILGIELIVFIAVSSISFAGVIVLLYERHRKS